MKILDLLFPNRHKHMYQKIGFSERYDSLADERYSVRHYKCECGKKRTVDGRNDRIERSGRVIY